LLCELTVDPQHEKNFCRARIGALWFVPPLLDQLCDSTSTFFKQRVTQFVWTTTKTTEDLL